ncbi:MAG: DUF4129 domain-containing protein [Pyrinomonadaceae bacterium]
MGRKAVRLASILLLVVAGANVAVEASPLAEYRERIQRAVTAMESLTTRDEDEDDEAYDDRRASTLRSVRQIIPPQETVEFDGKTVSVDNSWLDAALDDYEKLGVDDAQRTNALARITERLYALGERMAEMESGGQEGAATSKDEDRRRLAAILEREEYRKKRDTEKGALARLWERFVKWLDSLFPAARQLEPGESRGVSRLAQVIVYALAIGVIALLGWRYGPRLLRRDGRGKKSDKRGSRVVLGETLTADQTASDLLNEAEALARGGNLRAAIRKGYIALLCELGDRKIISLAQHKTNRDYLRAVEDRGTLHHEMRQLTASFENHWYGFATATQDDWTAFRARYREALK